MLGHSCGSIPLQQHGRTHPCSPLACRHRPAPAVLVQAKAGPDRGSVVALEAALSAINNILGSYNKVKSAAGKPQQSSTNGRSSGQQQQQRWAAGPSKLISFSAKAQSSVPVQEILSAAGSGDSSSSSSADWQRAPAPTHQQHSSSTTQQQASSSGSSSSSSEHSNKADSQHHSSGSSSPPHPKHYNQHHHHHQHKQTRKQHHKHQQQQHQQPSWLSSFTGKIPFAGSSGKEDLPTAALAKSLQAYLALPLEQYSVLDPKLITRLPDGVDVESVLQGMLAEQKQRRSNRRANQMQQAPSREASTTSSSSSTSAAAPGGQAPDLPKMRQLDVPQTVQQPQGLQELLSTSSDAPDISSSSGAAAGSSNFKQPSSPAAAAAEPAEPAAVEQPSWPAAGAAESAAVGAFLLRIPMLDLLGVDLEPLLVVYVDIDPQQGQVKFHTNRLVVGDPRFDQEFKVDLTATLKSKVVQPAVLVPAHPAAGHQDTSSSTSSSASSSASSSTSSSASSSPTIHPLQHEDHHLPLAAAAPAAAIATLTVASQDQMTAAEFEYHLEDHQEVWQRSSALSCKVKLGMSLRLPHPLSIAPGPLLSTTAGLVARLVMQALLPSFLELLVTDYGRWASGSSTSSRQETAAGSLITAGKQQLHQMQQ